MYDFRFYQACMGQTQLVYKVGWGYVVGFIGENLERANGLRYLIFFPLSQVCFFIMGFQWVQGVDNSIRLKELQVVSVALRKGDEGLGGFLSFPKGFFWGEEGSMR